MQPSPTRTAGPVPPDETRAVLDDVAGAGPWFALAPLPAAPGPEWERWDALYGPPGHGTDRLGARIDQVAVALDTDRRIAASIAVQGMAARLVSAPLATVALHGVLPGLDDLHRAPGAEDPWAPGIPCAPGTGAPAAVRTPDPRTDPAGAAEPLAHALAGLLDPLYAAVVQRASVSQRVLRGNAVSAVAGAARVLESGRRADRAAYLGVLSALVGHPALRGPLPAGATGRLLLLDDDDPATEWSYRRNSCCLYVKVPGGGTCGDCVLNGRGTRGSGG
ncbi:(2Fe-2S)-binding protein [Pseudonocardia phyllosphaerae]|uniref:(2Fe-2S)-binding protein n=1 Tax=Pseudonocardia phyllosphaerae TaxID=3390502 RepID=UPI003978C236